MDLEFLLRLNQLPQFGVGKVTRLLKRVDEAFLLHATSDDLRALGWSAAQIQRWQKPLPRSIAPALEWAQKCGRRIISYFDDDYPFLLKQISAAPLLLFVQGQASLLAKPQLAMVGSRECSDYGRYWGAYFAQKLAMQGLVITSGMALGIDGVCHRAALECGGETIAVLGCGLHHIYPKRNARLAQQIIEQGALVSEFLPDQAPVAENFPRRNRIISGLSLGTLVIEADIKSGSLITARYALEQNRDVFALPGAVQNQYSRGTHALIKQGAMLVEDYTDILENIHFHPCTCDEPAVNQDEDKQVESAVSHPALFAHIGFQPICVDDLAHASGLSVNDVLTQLLDLELEGAVVSQDGGYCRV
ncbi:DNA-protecting protein DprA [Pasteurellaceae bacterium HPA106]|uniref:DNA-processing protein DprA n=1 Tax=Spirabiliibacterium pneumoniae TaxID=221400 RepID=UPI001AADC682|nr:DNA-processing protein DprA [Spirabiliibacterium pneumoniae]MBE2897008.1 DNA-protecting protein DprA [Spirabiliibacterium pneumoniae]